MKYSKYKQGVLAINKTINYVLTHKVLFISGAAVVGTSVTGAGIASGNVVEEVACPNQIVYGETIEYSFNSILSSDAKYEYRIKGQEEWSEEVPVDVGTYETRAYSIGMFDVKKTSDIFEFDIVPKEININITSTELVYGDIPKYEDIDLAFEDHIESIEFDYINVLTNPTISYRENSLSIINKDGKDVTDYYIVSSENKEIQLKQGRIVFESNSLSKEYDGLSYKQSFEDSLECELIGNLIGEDRFECTFNISEEKNIGSVKNEYTCVIKNKYDEDVTSLYLITYVKGDLTINKRKLDIQTKDFNSIYNGEMQEYSDYELINDTSIIEGEEGLFNLSSLHSSKNVIKEEYSVEFAQLDEISKNYELNVLPGIFEIKQANLELSTIDVNKVYDEDIFNNVDNDLVIKSGQLFKDDHFVIDQSTVKSFKNVDSDVVNEYSFKIKDKENNDVTSNYNYGSVEYGKLNITPYELYISTGSIGLNDNNELVGITYDGEYHYDNNVFYKNSSNEVKLANTNHKFKEITDYPVFINANDEVLYNNFGEENIIILDANDNDVTVNYEFVEGIAWGQVKINKYVTSLSTNDIDIVYDGIEHYDITVNSTNGLANTKHNFKVSNYTKSTDIIYTINSFDIDIIDENNESVINNYNLGNSIDYGKFI